jgi:hypothetical protein
VPAVLAIEDSPIAKTTDGMGLIGPILMQDPRRATYLADFANCRLDCRLCAP